MTYRTSVAQMYGRYCWSVMLSTSSDVTVQFLNMVSVCVRGGADTWLCFNKSGLCLDVTCHVMSHAL